MWNFQYTMNIRNLLSSLLLILFVLSLFVFPTGARFVFTHFLYLLELMFVFLAWSVFSRMKKESRFPGRSFFFSVFSSLPNNPKLLDVISTGIKNNILGIFVPIFLSLPFFFPIFPTGLSEKLFFGDLTFGTVASILWVLCIVLGQICGGYWTFQSFQSRAWIWGLLFFVVYIAIFWVLIFICAFTRLDKESVELVGNFLNEPFALIKLLTYVGFFSGAGFFLGSIIASFKRT